MGQTLSSPVTEKQHCVEGSDERIKYAASSMQGWRITMEDAHTAILNLNESKGPHVSFFGVYDGHGGTAVAHYAGQHLHTKIASNPEFQKGEYVAALRNGFLELDQEIAQGASFQTDVSGCTACTCLITEDWRCVVGNAGDSRAVLSRKGRAVPLSVDHKPYNPKERERITKAGGFVQVGRVNGNLALSRALGDLDFKKNHNLPPEEQAVTANPEVYSYLLTDDDEFIIIACDGIWDCLTNQETVDFVRVSYSKSGNFLTVCHDLMDHCLAEVGIDNVGCDNMTVVIVALLKNRTEEELLTSIREDVFANNIQIALPHMIMNEDYEDEMMDDEVTEAESDGGSEIMKAIQIMKGREEDDDDETSFQ